MLEILNESALVLSLRRLKDLLRNHAAGIASLDLFVVRTISFKLLYGLVILHQARRRLVTISVTTNPTAQWIAGQVTEAFSVGRIQPHR